MSTTRDTLSRLFRSGEIALERSRFLDQEPAPLTARFSFDKIDGMMLGLAMGDALDITTETWLPPAVTGTGTPRVSNRCSRSTSRSSDDTMATAEALAVGSS